MLLLLSGVALIYQTLSRDLCSFDHCSPYLKQQKTEADISANSAEEQEQKEGE